jgi:hypothetical protein
VVAQIATELAARRKTREATVPTETIAPGSRSRCGGALCRTTPAYRHGVPHGFTAHALRGWKGLGDYQVVAGDLHAFVVDAGMAALQHSGAQWPFL